MADMRILVVGAGAVGGFFGAHLAAAGRDVTFLVRPERARSLAEQGLVVRSVDGSELRVEPQTVTADQLDASYDLVLVAVKAYMLDAAVADFRAAVGPETRVLPALNGMRHLDVLRAEFGADRVLGGVAVVISQLDDDGAIRQLMPGAGLIYGALGAGPDDRATAVHAALAGAGFDANLSDSIEQDMWDKWVFLAAGGAVTTLLRGVAGEVTAVPHGLATAQAIVAEIVATATAAGFAPRTSTLARIDTLILRPGSPFATSMYRDLLSGRPVEADQILGDLLRRAGELGMPAPLTTAAFVALEVHSARLATVE